MLIQLELEPHDPLAAQVRRALQRTGGVRIARPSERAQLTISRASRVRPTLTISSSSRRLAPTPQATALGASILAWEGDDGWLFWQHCRAPITQKPLRGKVEPAGRWLLVDESDLDRVPAQAAPGDTWHALVETVRRAPDHVVQWRRREHVIAPLLGVCTVVGSDGPLVFDAWRLHTPVLEPSTNPIACWKLLTAPISSTALAYVVPPRVWQTTHYWSDLAATIPSDGPQQLSAAMVRAARAEPVRRDLDVRLRSAAGRLRTEPGPAIRSARAWLLRSLFSTARRPPPGSR